jgi:hypothetical protein
MHAIHISIHTLSNHAAVNAWGQNTWLNVKSPSGALLRLLFELWPVFNATLLQAWPKDASTGLYALLFHGLIAALLSLYLFFWLKWNLADTLPVALVLGAALAFVGHRALSGLATARLQTASKRD